MLIYAVQRGLSIHLARGTLITCSGTGGYGGQVQDETDEEVERVAFTVSEGVLPGVHAALGAPYRASPLVIGSLFTSMLVAVW